MKEQYIEINNYGGKFYYSDKEMKILHREDGSAIELKSGTKCWYINGKRHREDGPAVECSNGHKEWWINGKRHREDGPAIEYSNGDKSWWINGVLHRDDGPAIEHYNGYKEWWINGKEYTEKRFDKITEKSLELTLDEIAAKFDVSVENLRIKK